MILQAFQILPLDVFAKRGHQQLVRMAHHESLPELPPPLFVYFCHASQNTRRRRVPEDGKTCRKRQPTTQNEFCVSSVAFGLGQLGAGGHAIIAPEANRPGAGIHADIFRSNRLL